MTPNDHLGTHLRQWPDRNPAVQRSRMCCPQKQNRMGLAPHSNLAWIPGGGEKPKSPRAITAARRHIVLAARPAASSPAHRPLRARAAPATSLPIQSKLLRTFDRQKGLAPRRDRADKRSTGELIAVGGRKEKPRGSPGLKRSPIGASRIDQFLHLTFGRSANEARAPLLYARCPVD